MAPVAMKLVLCASCRETTQHPLPILQQICAHLPESATETERINYCCPYCNHLGHAWIPGKSTQLDPESRSEALADTVPFQVAIECAERSCRSRVEVFAPMMQNDVGTNLALARDRVKDWIVSSAVSCQGEHCVLTPCAVAGIKIVEPT
jgi:hypothetical protein